ncbi:NAD-P-binding protein [Cubamyces lactineus]|nr:NAD-P-binding protein [Cubamyces lactineus]
MSHPQCRVWFITGTSTGFGRALAEVVLAKGEAVVATARTPSALADLVAQYPSDRLLTFKLDITQPSQVTDAFERAREVFGRIDVVVNNAGCGHAGEFESMDDEMARAIMDTNFWGTVNVTRQALRFFREVNPKGHGGRLLQNSSMLGVVGKPAFSFYVASKFALEGLTESMAQELDPAWNIKVTLIEPGWFQTSMKEGAKWAPQHPVYQDADLPVSRLRAVWESFVCPGDVHKAVEAIYKVAALPDPPLHFPLGKDALAEIQGKLDEFGKVLKEYRSWSEGLLADEEARSAKDT